MQIGKNTKLMYLVKPSTANTSLNSLSAAIDMSGYEGARFIAMCGNTTGDALFQLYVSGSTASGGNYTTLTGGTVITTTGMADGLLSVDVYKPQTRFLKGGLHRNGANAGHGGLLVELYGASKVPVSNDSTSMLIAAAHVVGTT